MPKPQYKDIIFPQDQNPSLSNVLTSLRRTNLTIHNRLASIRADARFVLAAAEAYGGRPLVANERCGSWYIAPADKAGSAYFKSTDGHERAWKFSTRRLNLHLVDIIEKNDGVIIVDSTRRGKRMPDALSATIPIWCTVMNLALLPSNPLSSHLFLPPSYSPSTHAQIAALIPTFLASLRELNLALPTTLTKPLRPFWVTQDSALDDRGKGDVFEDYRPVICCTASRRVVAGCEADEGGYIQGAADDTENWAHGLTPDVFWNNAAELLQAPEEDLPELITTLVAQEKSSRTQAENVTRLTPHISVCPLPLSPSTAGEGCCIALTPDVTPKDAWVESPRHMKVGLGKSKAASRNLRIALPDICAFATKYLASSGASGGHIVIACESGRDLSVGTALALSCYLFDDEGNFRIPDETRSYTKPLVKIRLGTIMTAYPGGNPSRNTLQSVNSFLMDWRK
ncbi:tRNA A64-2'-O-ribosylphosphate transferase-like protein [Hapsidospora chrysogenum ATCC 11550]|uniref:tRNA A64-2'-O-ribosylphosphate transferase-like protein n=1 Tax=Hapsidospora chrysogenum (strain ATCC 11550 / CBS 779.69 / DSM 880 / IAM 14645 / JCM 23072 / IMI 49137) TaxID=857340 RepID=A0A086TC86_HAPC1|nr:tRNA A64-2'-O-ribosylphosphate transferase-like protein [Hapsidospora chrysogenum ATCC 11550]